MAGVIGSTIGALVGSPIGDGRGQPLATGIGALLGGLIGETLSQRRQRKDPHAPESHAGSPPAGTVRLSGACTGNLRLPEPALNPGSKPAPYLIRGPGQALIQRRRWNLARRQVETAAD